MFKNKNILLFTLKVTTALLLVVTFFTSNLRADVYGTTAGTIITAGEINLGVLSGPVVTYNPTSKPQVTVAQIGGINQTLSPVNKGTRSNTTVEYTMRYENKGNLTDAILVERGAIYYAGDYGSLWSVSALNTTNATMPDYGDAVIDFEVTVPNDAKDGSAGTVTMNVRSNAIYSSSAVGGSYIGYNLFSYGGISDIGNTIITSVANPVIDILSRTVTASAPAQYAGAGDSPVPGSLLTYTMQVRNSGSAIAQGLVVREAITGVADYYLGSMTNNRGGTMQYRVGITDQADSGSGVTQNVNRLTWTFDLGIDETATLEYSYVIK